MQKNPLPQAEGAHAPEEWIETPSPQPMNESEPRHNETRKETADERAKATAEQGPIISKSHKIKTRQTQSLTAAPVNQAPIIVNPLIKPIPVAGGPTRPSSKTPEHEHGGVIVAKTLAPQLATDPNLLAQGQWDERKLAVLDDGTLAAMSHFSHRFTYDGVRYWGHICEWWLTGSQGIGGRGRTDILKAMMAASTGGPTPEKAHKPNILSRNLFNRDWKSKAQSEGKEVEE